MKKLLLMVSLFSVPVQATLSWRQTAGIGCLASAGALGVRYPKTIKKGAKKVRTFVKEHPGRTMIGLTTLGVALLARRQDIRDLNQATHLARNLQKLIQKNKGSL